MSPLAQQCTLPDGRHLGYDDLGNPAGPPVFYFHGAPSSRVDWAIFGGEPLASQLGVRLIAVDRPGLGLSSFQPGRSFSSWPSDALALADGLGIQRFAVLAHSGGGPYALACARMIPQRLTAVGVVSGSGQFDRPGAMDAINPDSRRFMETARDRPWLFNVVALMMGATARFAPERVAKQAMAALPEPDRAVMARPEVARGFVNAVRAALRQGPRGARLDTALMVGPWDFRPQEIQMTVRFWHGEADRNAPIEMARHLVAMVPNSQAAFMPGEGHLSLMVRHAGEILGVLTA